MRALKRSCMKSNGVFFFSPSKAFVLFCTPLSPFIMAFFYPHYLFYMVYSFGITGRIINKLFILFSIFGAITTQHHNDIQYSFFLPRNVLLSFPFGNIFMVFVIYVKEKCTLFSEKERKKWYKQFDCTLACKISS